MQHMASLESAQKLENVQKQYLDLVLKTMNLIKFMYEINTQ